MRIRLVGNAESSTIEIMSHGYSPTAHALYEFPATITGAINHTTAFLHNLTRMWIQLVLSTYVLISLGVEKLHYYMSQSTARKR